MEKSMTRREKKIHGSSKGTQKSHLRTSATLGKLGRMYFINRQIWLLRRNLKKWESANWCPMWLLHRQGGISSSSFSISVLATLTGQWA
ncbi:hypothetical protein I7I48_11623 [Histoplasma ohiense]|nr:hypothetical protein I7I48_11623 [Histoplasma ohiense (nom. inval.)]